MDMKLSTSIVLKATSLSKYVWDGDGYSSSSFMSSSNKKYKIEFLAGATDSSGSKIGLRQI